MTIHTPVTSGGDAYSVGQLAQRWERTTSFVRGLVNAGHVHTDDRGFVTNEELGRFYADGGQALLDGN